MEGRDLSGVTVIGDPQSLENKISAIRAAGAAKLQVYCSFFLFHFLFKYCNWRLYLLIRCLQYVKKTGMIYKDIYVSIYQYINCTHLDLFIFARYSNLLYRCSATIMMCYIRGLVFPSMNLE